MTSKIEMKQSSEDSIEEVDAEKQKKIQKKLKDLGVMPSEDNEPEEAVPENATKVENIEPETVMSRKFSPVLITVILAFFAAGVLAYTYMSEDIAELLALNKSSDNSAQQSDISNNAANTSNISNISNPNAQAQAGNALADSTPADYRASLQEYREQTQRNHDEWLATQRADSDKRREAFMKQNARSQFNQPGYSQPSYNQPGFNQAEMNNQQSFNQRQWEPVAPPEPPQWVKDQQAEAEKQRAQYMQEIKQQQENMSNNRYNSNFGGNQRPEYFNHPRLKPYSSQQDRPAQAIQPQQQPNVAYQQNQRQYYRPYNYGARPPVYNSAPAYRYGPNYAPYGWQARPYR